jgi:beta-galactosidase
MKIGTYYYPEQWPREQWARDLDNIAAMGLRLIHVGEFAWGTIEPSPDRFELDWIDEILGLAQARGLDVILCTPTAIIPSWLSQQTPDIFWSGLRFGGRRHANHLHPVYQDRSRRVVQAMADRFGNHPSVIGWQIDNEFNGGVTDQSQYTHAAFRQWLRDRYQNDIAKLNDAWGCSFWNTYYSDFEQIKYPPGRDPAPEYRNQHETLDAQRFLSWSYAQYIKLQADILKARVGDRWITTNFMPFFLDIDPGEAKESLSLWSWDTYPISGILSEAAKDERFRMADPETPGFIHAQMRGYNGRWGLMEVQPGQINWSGRPVKPMPGAIRLLLWQAIAQQAEFITVYRFRQPRVGIEMWHDGLVQWDGVTPSAGGREFSQVAAEVKLLDEKVAGSTRSDSYATMQRDPNLPAVGVLHDHDQLWYYASLPQAKRFSQTKLVTQYHAALERCSLNADVVRLDSDWSKLKLLVVPGLQMANADTIAKLYDYVRNGGHLITTGRSLILDKQGRAPETIYGAALNDLLGSQITGYDSLPDHTFGNVEMNGRKHRWGAWADFIEPGENVQVLAKYADQFYEGSPAVVQNRYGDGTVTHVGAVDEGSLTDAVVEDVVRQLGLPVRIIATRTKLYRMAGGVCVFINANDRTVEAPAQKWATFLVGDRRVK